MDNKVEFFVAHVGINEKSDDSAMSLAQALCTMFDWNVKNGNSSIFAGKGFEIMKSPYLGTNGHVAIGTNDINAAVELLKSKGIEIDDGTKKLSADGSLKAGYLKGEFGGFALHLVQA